MSTAEDRMYDAKEQERLDDIDGRHDRGNHDERPDEDCERCQNSIRDREAFYRPSRAERVTVDAEGWVRDWDFILDEARGK